MVGRYCSYLLPKQAGNSPNSYLQNLANDGTPNSVERSQSWILISKITTTDIDLLDHPNVTSLNGSLISYSSLDDVVGGPGQVGVGGEVFQVGAPGGNCIKTGLPGKLILSKRKVLQEVLFS